MQAEVQTRSSGWSVGSPAWSTVCWDELCGKLGLGGISSLGNKCRLVLVETPDGTLNTHPTDMCIWKVVCSWIKFGFNGEKKSIWRNFWCFTRQNREKQGEFGSENFVNYFRDDTLLEPCRVKASVGGVCGGGICTFLRMCDHISEHVIDSVRGRQSYRNPRGKKWEHAPRQFIKENKNLWPLTFNIQTYLILQPAWHLHILQEWFQTSELKGQFEAFFWYTHDFKSNILKQVKIRWNSSLCLYLSASGKLVRSVYWFKTMLKCPVWSRNKKICYVTSVVYMCS